MKPWSKSLSNKGERIKPFFGSKASFFSDTAHGGNMTIHQGSRYGFVFKLRLKDMLIVIFYESL